jgi:hypothetical protein
MSTAYYDLLLTEDLNLGTGTGTKRNPGGGSLTGTQVGIHSFGVGTAAATATWNPGSIASGAEEAKEITVSGAALGDFVLVSFSLDVSDLTLTANVTAENTVTAVLANLTGAAVNLAEGTVKVLVLKSA